MCLPHIRLQLFTLTPIFFYYITHVHLLQFSPPSIPDILYPPPPSFARFCDTRISSLYYINDLPACLSFSIPRMYADDTRITYAGSDLHFISRPWKLSKWIVSNRLTLNATKTEFMLIGSRQRLSTLSYTLERSIDNVPIEQVPSVKSLGIYIDENLTWHSHIDKLCKKIASGAIKRVKPFVPQSTILNTYISLVQSHFDYCRLVWGNCGKHYLTSYKNCKTVENCCTSNNFIKLWRRCRFLVSQTQLERLEISTSNSERLNGFQVFKPPGSWVSNVYI